MKLTEDFFILSDLHFGHKNIIEYSRREFTTIQEHDDHIVSRWNGVVKKDDKCLILGDIAFRKDALSRFSEMNGIKYLIAGNHDHYSAKSMAPYFHDIKGAVNWTDPARQIRIVFTHIPVHPAQLVRWDLNIHGHTHGYWVSNLFSGQPDNRYMNVCCEAMGFVPHKLGVLLDWWKPNLKQEAKHNEFN